MKKILLVGVGYMGCEYAKVLNALHIPYIAVGRGAANAEKFKEITGHDVIQGGIELFLNETFETFDKAIIATPVEYLSEHTKFLISNNIKNILLEKPGGKNPMDIIGLAKYAKESRSDLFLAYNRRFYSSVLEAEKIIKQDGGLTSFSFEFTEWSHEIESLSKPKEILANWFLANSSHVADLAFFLGGLPIEWNHFHSCGLKWHPSASIFSGAGITNRNILFSYQANWESPGRWAIELCTKDHRLYLKPMESLQIQEIGSVSISPVNIDRKLDIEFKPGLFLELKSFFEGKYDRFCRIQEQAIITEKVYVSIANYDL